MKERGGWFLMEQNGGQIRRAWLGFLCRCTSGCHVSMAVYGHVMRKEKQHICLVVSFFVGFGPYSFIHSFFDSFIGLLGEPEVVSLSIFAIVAAILVRLMETNVCGEGTFLRLDDQGLYVIVYSDVASDGRQGETVIHCV